MNPFRINQRIILIIASMAIFQLSFTSSSACCQEMDLAEYQVRELDKERLENIKQRPEYDYSIRRGDGTTLWQRIRDWFRRLLESILGAEASGPFIRFLIYALIIGAIVFSILKFLNTNPATIFNRSRGQNIPYTVAEENIHEIDFEKEINLAMENHDYRLATRLIYLRSLKLLSDNDFIHWNSGKTNADYYYELQDEKLKDRFSSLGHMFEYVWYGGFSIELPVLKRAKDLFQEIKSLSLIKE